MMSHVFLNSRCFEGQNKGQNKGRGKDATKFTKRIHLVPWFGKELGVR